MYPQGKVLRRRKQGDIMIPTGEIIEVKSLPFEDASFVTGGESEPKYRTIVVMASGAESTWRVLGEIAIGTWIRGRPDKGKVISWYAPIKALQCVREWGCSHA